MAAWSEPPTLEPREALDVGPLVAEIHKHFAFLGTLRRVMVDEAETLPDTALAECLFRAGDCLAAALGNLQLAVERLDPGRPAA